MIKSDVVDILMKHIEFCQEAKEDKYISYGLTVLAELLEKSDLNCAVYADLKAVQRLKVTKYYEIMVNIREVKDEKLSRPLSQPPSTQPKRATKTKSKAKPEKSPGKGDNQSSDLPIKEVHRRKSNRSQD